MSALDAIPPGFRHPPVIQAFQEVTAERDLLLAVLQEIANTDGRYGERMREAANTAVVQILETRVDRKIATRRSIQ
jgi:hypothetical protein